MQGINVFSLSRMCRTNRASGQAGCAGTWAPTSASAFVQSADTGRAPDHSPHLLLCPAVGTAGRVVGHRKTYHSCKMETTDRAPNYCNVQCTSPSVQQQNLGQNGAGHQTPFPIPMYCTDIPRAGGKESRNRKLSSPTIDHNPSFSPVHTLSR